MRNITTKGTISRLGISARSIGRTAFVAALAAANAATASAATLGDMGERANVRMGVAAGVYFSIPLTRERRGPARLGLRLTGIRDHRNALGSGGEATKRSVLDLRLAGELKPTLFIGATPVTGPTAAKHKLAGSGAVALGILAAAAVATLVIVHEVGEDDDDEQCLLPEGCP